MEFEQITTELSDHVLTITLNRPERLNAFTATMGDELRAAFDTADADDDVRAVIVTGAGPGILRRRRPRARRRDVHQARPRRTPTRSRATAAAGSRCGSSSAPSR